MNSRGFTLFELLVVLAILGLAVSLALPRLSTALSGVRLESVAEDMANELRRARSRAVVESRNVAFRFDLDTGSYDSGNGAERIQLPAEVTLILQGHLGDIVRQGIGEMLFFPDGSTTGGQIVIGREADSVTLRVDWLTGRVYLLEPS